MIEKEDILIVIGEIKKLDKLQEKANEKEFKDCGTSHFYI